jgi:hypothetical protein
MKIIVLRCNRVCMRCQIKLCQSRVRLLKFQCQGEQLNFLNTVYFYRLCPYVVFNVYKNYNGVVSIMKRILMKLILFVSWQSNAPRAVYLLCQVLRVQENLVVS